MATGVPDTAIVLPSAPEVDRFMVLGSVLDRLIVLGSAVDRLIVLPSMALEEKK